MAETSVYLRHNLERIPFYPLPDGFEFTSYKKGDEAQWSDILAATGEFIDKAAALDRFHQEMGPAEDLDERMIFIRNQNFELVGTVTAWYGTVSDIEMGRLHWVEIIPDYQGLGLGRPLISKGMQILKEKHGRAYLKTQNSSRAAIHLYRKLGWYPIKVNQQHV